MASFIKSDLEFILEQIIIAERNAAGEDLASMLPNAEVPFGLRTVTGEFNNVVAGRDGFGAADLVFPRMTTPVFNTAESMPAGFFGPGSPAGPVTSYAQTSGLVFDSQPRIISNLIVDQTANNPAAIAAAAANPGSEIVTSPGLDGLFGTADDTLTHFIPNVASDEGLSAPFNSWMTFFGQFFDHGLDLVNKGGNGTIFIPLQPDDPLFVPGSPTNFMVVTRATMLPGPDGVLGTADDIHENTNQTSPFVDQNQTYSSHPSHQVFLRAYEFDAAGKPVSNGKLIVNRDLGADGVYGTADDVAIGGMATWKVVKAQARDMLGIELTDTDVFDLPLLATDAYGKFIPGPNGFAQVVMKGADGIAGTADDVLVEGNPAAPISLTNAVRTGHPFLADIAHAAAPNPGLVADADAVAGGSLDPVAPGTYDNELLDAHYIAGDGRVNENIGLTTVHHIFHSEHNRLVEHTKDVILQSGDVAFLNQWLLSPVGAIPADPSTLVWNGERLFQTAKFGTEMQYQHLVFEEFARTIQPNIDAFIDFQDTVNPAIVAEFAHTVYRFGHSMLVETIDRLDPNFVSSEIGLIRAFLNPLEFAASGLTPDQAAGAIVRGVTRQVGNEIDEFVTEALRNNLVGLPLDLAAINIARGRDTGIPSLNAARRTFFDGTGDSQLMPYTSWVDYAQHLKHEESVINFIAAYGTHSSITGATTLADKRHAATLLVLGDEMAPGPDGVLGTADDVVVAAAPADRLDFLHSTGAWASGLDGITTTGLDNVDFWIGGLAEEKMPFGGMLGATFNFVFETQLEALQNGDRLYYLHRTAGMNFLTELENNSFATLIMNNTDATHLPAVVFTTPGLTLEVDPTKQFNANVVNDPGLDGVFGPGPGLDGIQGTADDTPSDDVATPTQDPIGDNALIPLVIRDNPATPGPDTNYLQYTGPDHVVLGGTAANDILIASEGDDTLYGDGGNDRLEGGYGNDNIFGGPGDDIITDIGGDDVVHGEEGNDVISGGNGADLLIAGPGNDFIIAGEGVTEVFAGPGNDFILGNRLDAFPNGNEGDDWLERGLQDGAVGDNFDPLGLDPIPGNDVFLGDGGFDETIGEGGDDIAVGSDGGDKYDGMSGFDWVTFKDDRFGVRSDFEHGVVSPGGLPAPVAAPSVAGLARFFQVEGVSGSAHADILRGGDAVEGEIRVAGNNGSVLTNFDLIAGLRAFTGDAAAGVDGITGTADDQFAAGDMILGGDGSDILEGRGGNDLIDGDKWLNVRISVRANADGTGPEIDSYDSMIPMIPLMLNGTYNPGQLVITREILNGAGGFDTAFFSGNLVDYTVTTAADGSVTVADGTAFRDGTDRLTNIERLQFNDQSLVLVPGLNADPTGLLAVSDATPAVGQTLTVSPGTVADADGIAGSFNYVWQVETIAGSGVFHDYGVRASKVATALSDTFTVGTDVAGLALRVKAHYLDANGVQETVFSAPTTAVGPGTPPPPPAPLLNGPQTGIVSPGVHFIGSDLQFILTQIKMAEQHSAGADPVTLVDNLRMAQGLRTVDGSFNNLVTAQTEFGASDNVFPRLTTPNFRDAETFDPDGPGPAPATPTSYTQTSGLVVDSQPRTISNLIVDMTANNPAAVAAAAQNPGSSIVDGMRADGTPFQTFAIPNVAPDVGLSAPFNAWMTFFGQFFDHGLDLVNKGGNGAVFIPLQPDDPLFVPGSPTNFMVMTRATMLPGPDGVVGTADDIHEHINQTSPFVDQNQTYSSHPSHQVFLRAYEFDASGRPVSTGNLIVNRDLGADGQFGTADDVVIGGMATWKVVKAQARDMLGIELSDADVFDLPLLATDAYGKFIPGPNGFAQMVMKGIDGIAGTADDFLLEGNPLAPISTADAVKTGHQFLNDIAHAASPNPGLVADADTVAGGPPPAAGEYDNELLDAHYIAGDGRVNENIGLTTVHHIFHSEHNRLVEHTKAVVLDTAAAGDVSFLNEWLLTPVAAVPADLSTLVWNGERLFQAAKFGTEMQYQHLVFEEFARTLQPQIDVFIAPSLQNYQTEIDAAIVAEFAHTVYRFGHSMLTETIDRLDPNFVSSEIGLIQAFLNPLEFAASGPTPDAAAGAIVRGLTRQTGNEIDEFVTEALRNNLVGLPLDLPAINLARGRDTGIPSLNAARSQFYNSTGDSALAPYTSWGDFVQHLKHPESLVNFIAAYGTHSTITAATTLVDKRAAATLLVLGDQTQPGLDGIPGTADDVVVAAPADRIDFLMSAGTWTGLETGLNNVDFWIGGLAEKIMPFGGMLGSTFNFVFENQLEKLQNADRFYYLERTSGLNFLTELENNSFAKLIMANTDATHLPGLVFQNNLILEVDPARQFNESVIGGPDGIVLDNPATPVDESADNLPASADPVGGSILVPLVIRDNPATVGPDTNYLQYTGPDHVTLGGTAGNDIMISSEGDDTLYGDAGNDRLEGGFGNDTIRGGPGDDIITDIGGDDVIHGEDGNDVIHGGNGLNLILAGFGNDFIINGDNGEEAFGGPGNDFMLGSDPVEQNMGNEGDDWLEGGLLDGSPGDNFDPLNSDLIIGNDVYIGTSSPDIMNAEGGDDIMVGSSGSIRFNGDKYLGASGFDWATFKNEMAGVGMDLTVRAFDAAPGPVAAGVVAKFSSVEGLAGSAFSDYLRGDNVDALTIPFSGAQGSVLTNFDLISGLRAFVGDAAAGLDGLVGTADDRFGAGNIILGGDGSDMIEGRGGDDLIDGDQWLNVRISVRANADGTGAEIDSYDSMVPLVPFMLNGIYNPGQLVIAREILPGNGGFNFDTAVFSDVLANYDFIFDPNGTVTVTHLNLGVDGTDRLTNIERLQFNDQAVVLTPGLNNEPAGLLTLSSTAPSVGAVLTVSAAGVTDADNITSGGALTGAVTYYWQFETVPGSGVFQDILIRTGLGLETVTGTSFTVPASFDDGLPADGTAIRVRALYEDEHGVLEMVFSAPTSPVFLNVAPAGTDATLTTNEDTALVLATANFGFTDANVVDGDSLSAVRIDTVPLAGALTLSGVAVTAGQIIFAADITAGNLVFTPAPEANGAGYASFTFSVADQASVFDPIPNTLIVNVTAVNDLPVGTVLVSDTTPTEGQPLTATNAFTDIDGLGVITNQWESSADGINWTPIAGATGLSFTPTQAEVGSQLRIVASYTDGGGTLEVVASAATTVVGDVAIGTAGADLLVGTAGEDILQGLGGNDTLLGLAGNDQLEGGAGSDTLNGGAGADTMVGGLGNDIFVVDDALDVVTEAAGAGTDTVQTTLASFALGTNVENLTFIGTGSFTGTGNAVNNVIRGGSGADTLNGLAGNDILIGGAGADTMSGGAGNDIYVVDNALDVVSEIPGAGTDTVQATSASYTLGANVENLIFIGTGNFTGTGNAANNVIRGGSGADTLNGGAGNDTLIGNAGADTLVGGIGNDTYVVDNASDVVIEGAGEGTDTVQATSASYTLGANVENLLFTGAGSFTGTGNASNNVIRGGNGADTLNGAAGNDVLIGGGGADTMAGGTGNDTYVVDNALDVVTEAAGAGIDTVQTALANYILGANVENLIYTGNGNFTGTGNALANTIRGRNGADHLTGGNGNDFLDGGAGNDVFVFAAAGFGADRIQAFDANAIGGQDLLDISGLGITAATFAGEVSITDVGADTLVGIGADSIRLLGIGDATTIDASDFILS